MELASNNPSPTDVCVSGRGLHPLIMRSRVRNHGDGIKNVGRASPCKGSDAAQTRLVADRKTDATTCGLIPKKKKIIHHEQNKKNKNN